MPIPRMTLQEKIDEADYLLAQFSSSELIRFICLLNFIRWKAKQTTGKMTLLKFLFGAWIYYTEYQPMMLNK